MNKSCVKLRCGGVVFALFLLFNSVYTTIPASVTDTGNIGVDHAETDYHSAGSDYARTATDIQSARVIINAARMIYMTSGEVPELNAVLKAAEMVDLTAATADVEFGEFYKLETYIDPRMSDYGIVFKITFTAGEKAGEYAGEYVVTEWGELPSPEKK